MKQWYAIQTKPNREFLARNALNAVAGVETYLPVLRLKPVNPRARKERPFFSGYLFAHTDLEEVGTSAIQWTAGVVCILSYGDQPIPIPNQVIQEISDRVDEVQEEDPYGVGRFRQGDRVRVQSGPLAGYEGMFDIRLSGRMRARVLVDCVGRQTAVDLDVRTLEKVTPDRRRSS